MAIASAFVDSHTHICLPDFDADRDLVIQRAFQAGAVALISVGIDFYCSRAAVELAGSHPSVFAAVGFHPDCAIAINDTTLAQLSELAREPKVVAIGEIGLDFEHNISAKEIQLEAFRRQLELASQLNLPVVIHDGNAHKEVMRVLRNWAVLNPLANRRFLGVLHGFSGGLTMARECVSLGFLISVAGNVTYPDAKKLVEVVRRLPLENLLVETDSPFSTPFPHQGERNEPANVRFIAEKIAEIKGVTIEEVGRVTTRNASILFDLALPESSA